MTGIILQTARSTFNFITNILICVIISIYTTNHTNNYLIVYLFSNDRIAVEKEMEREKVRKRKNTNFIYDTN